MAVEHHYLNNNTYRAATVAFDLNKPGEALPSLLEFSQELLSAQRSAIYEYNEQEGGFTPRFARGISLAELGHISSGTEHLVLASALSSHRAASSESSRGSLGLPLSPGVVACAPCMTMDKTTGIIFVAKDQDDPFDDDALATLEILAIKAAEILTFAKQSSAQNYLFHRLSLLYQASHAISGTRDRPEVLIQIAAHVLKASSANYCDIMIFDELDGKPIRFHHKLEKSGLQTVVKAAIDNIPNYPVHKQILSEIQPDVISVTPPIGSPKDIALLQEENFATAVIFPMATGNEALGLMRLLYERPGRQIHEQEIELAQAIVNIGAVGIQDAISLDAAEDRASQLQVLADIGREMTSTLDLEVALENTMRHTQQVLQCEACILFLLDEGSETLVLKASGGRHMRVKDVAIRLEEGIAGWVARNQRPLIVNDVRTNPLYQSAIDSQTGLLTSSVLCVPLNRRDEVVGVIEAINHPRGAFLEPDQQMLSSVASWAAIALDNANLFHSVAAERSRLETTLVETADSVVLTDRAGRIILVNHAAGQAFRINAELATGRLASEIFLDHPLGDILMKNDVQLPTTLEVTTPADRVLSATISEVTDVGRVAVMQDITALKQIDRMRSQLLGTAAHDLKNPLNAIRLGADLLNDAPLSDQQRKALYMMQRATDSMTNLITGLLETIRVETSSSLIIEPCDIHQVISTAIDDLRPLADSSQHTIYYEEPSEPLIIKGDLNRLSSVVNNILSNAIKFTKENGQIEITVDWDDDRILIEVTDNGPGIPEDELPRVFEHLFRGRVTVQDPDHPIDGTGLGLALSKTVIEQHGGRIWVTSKEGEGSTFSFTLPWEPTPKTGSLKKEDGPDSPK
jgi:two-component system NtrC family sensor kinase